MSAPKMASSPRSSTTEAGDPSEWVAALRVVAEADLTRLVGCRSIDVYTDGSAPRGNPGGPIGFAAVLVGKGKAQIDLAGHVPGRAQFPPTSNNRAELAALILALVAVERLIDQGATYTRLVIWSDSEYVIGCATGGKKRKVNTDLWSRLQPLLNKLQNSIPRGVELLWTRGHSGNKHNEEADVLAVQAVLRGEAAARRAPEPPPKLIEEPDYCLRVLGASYLIQTRSGRCRRVEVPRAPQLNGVQTEYTTLGEALTDLLKVVQKAGRAPREFHLLVECANELMIKQLGGEYKVRAPGLEQLHRQSKTLLRDWKSVELRWVQTSELRQRASAALMSSTSKP